MMIRQEFEDAANGIDVCTGIWFFARQLLWGCIAIGSSLGISESVSIATAKIDKFDIIVNTSQQDIFGLQVKM